MQTKPQKILLVGDASNCHRTLAEGLRRLGHHVVVASNGNRWMNTERDVDLRRRLPGKAGGLDLWMRLRHLCATSFRDFDIVSIGTPNFVDLRPPRILDIFNRLRDNNAHVFMTAYGTDNFFVRECLRDGSVLEFSEWRDGGRQTPFSREMERNGVQDKWLAGELAAMTEYIYDKTEGVTTVLYEYDRVVKRYVDAARVGYIGVPIDTSAVVPFAREAGSDACVNLFLGRHRERQLEKGSDLLEKAANIAIARNPGAARLTIVENRPFAEYIGLQAAADVVLDQIYSYTPATNALLAMARCLPVVSGGEPEFYDFIGETDNRPVFNSPHTVGEIADLLDSVIKSRGQLAEIGRESREFVVKHNDVDVVARRAIGFWNKITGVC